MKDLFSLFLLFLISPLLFLADYITAKTSGEKTYYGPGGIMIVFMLLGWVVLILIVVVIALIWWASQHFVYVS